MITHVQVEEVSGKDGLSLLKYRNTETGEVTEYRTAEGDSFGVFVFAGYEPATGLVQGLAECDAQGYVVTDRSQKTTCEGLYAAGDVCIKPLRQVVTAVGDGALAATELERYAAALQKKTGLYPIQPAAVSKEATAVPKNSQQTGGLFTPDMLSQLDAVFQKMASSLRLKIYLDDTPLSAELKGYMEELCALTDKLSLEMSSEEVEDRPCVRVCREMAHGRGLRSTGYQAGMSLHPLCWGFIMRLDRDRL